MNLTNVEFKTVNHLSADELKAFYARQNFMTTGGKEKLQQMIDNTHCIVTARIDGELVGFARGVTDGLWGRLAECKLDPAYQGPACISRSGGRIEHDTTGIARELAMRVIDALLQGGAERIDALAYGTEVDFCEELGFRKMHGVVPLELTAASAKAMREMVAASAQA